MEIQPGVDQIQAQDYPRVIEVWEASVRATHDFLHEDDIDLFRPLVRKELPQVEHLMGVRDKNGQIAGFIGVMDQKVEMLFLHPDARGQGAGKRLLTFAILHFGANALDVNEQNPRALGFYQHLGFEVVGRSELDWTGKPYPLLHMRLNNMNQG